MKEKGVKYRTNHKFFVLRHYMVHFQVEFVLCHEYLARLSAIYLS